MSLDKFVDRAATLIGAYGNFRTAPELVDAETIALARCTMINHELQLFIHFCYSQSEQGRYVNLRSNSQVPKGVWAPWGSSGKSGLTRTERDVTRRYLFSLITPRPPRPLFFYGQRHWHVNTVVYPTVEEALQWLGRFKITPTAWFDCCVVGD